MTLEHESSEWLILETRTGTFTYEQGQNYGCAGQGNFDCQEAIAGAQVDEADKAMDSNHYQP